MLMLVRYNEKEDNTRVKRFNVEVVFREYIKMILKFQLLRLLFESYKSVLKISRNKEFIFLHRFFIT